MLGKRGFILENRKGGPATQQDNDEIVRLTVQELKRRGLSAQHIAGAKKKERQLRGPSGGHLGSRWPDGSITYGPNDDTLDFNTASTRPDGSYTKDEENKLSGIQNRKAALEPNNKGPTWIFPKSRGIGRPDWTTAREREIGRLVDDIIEQLDFLPK